MGVIKHEIKIGDRFGLLTIIKKLGVISIRLHRRGESFLCKCDCGKEIIRDRDSLVSGNTRSCGCLSKKKSLNRFIKHGMFGHVLYGKWNTIKNRCCNPNFPNYRYYGGRGIKLYEKWINHPELFITYVERLPNYGERGMTLDRINNDGNYEPNNLRFASRLIQSRNRGKSKGNTSGYVGVRFCKINNKFLSEITVNKVYIYLGYHKTLFDAVNARNEYIIKNNLQEGGFNIQNYVRENN